MYTPETLWVCASYLFYSHHKEICRSPFQSCMQLDFCTVDVEIRLRDCWARIQEIVG